MKFGEIFEYHKIPEWYNMYLNYELLRQKIDDFNQGNPFKLPGYYFMGNTGEIKKIQLSFDSAQEGMTKPEQI